MAVVVCVILLGMHLGTGAKAGRARIVGGLVLFVLLFISPLCALTAALFSARVAHHVLLIAVVAPLLASAFPLRSRPSRLAIGWVAIIHAITFWFWHAPPVYHFAISNPLAFWAMQLSLLGTAVWFWHRALDRSKDVGTALLALMFITVQMGMLGALLTFASAPLYEWHLATTIPFGLTALQDQQLAGLLMWVPAALPYVVAALVRAWPLLGPAERRTM